MPNQSGKIILVLVLFLIVLGAATYFFIPSFKQEYKEQMSTYSPAPLVNTNKIDSPGEMKDYYSKDLKMSIQIPQKFNIDEKPAILKLKSGKELIEITRNITEYADLKEYLVFFDSKRNLTIQNENQIEVKSYEAMKRELKYKSSNQSEMAIFVYVDNYVYIFSTSDEALYPVLDQIVESFEYKP